MLPIRLSRLLLPQRGDMRATDSQRAPTSSLRLPPPGGTWPSRLVPGHRPLRPEGSTKGRNWNRRCARRALSRRNRRTRQRARRLGPFCMQRTAQRAARHRGSRHPPMRWPVRVTTRLASLPNRLTLGCHCRRRCERSRLYLAWQRVHRRARRPPPTLNKRTRGNRSGRTAGIRPIGR